MRLTSRSRPKSDDLFGPTPPTAGVGQLLPFTKPTGPLFQRPVRSETCQIAYARNSATAIAHGGTIKLRSSAIGTGSP